MNKQETLHKALTEIQSWGEERGGRWCREHARQALNSVKELPNVYDESYKSLRSSDASTFDFTSLYQQYNDDPRKALEILFEQKGKNYEYHGRGPALFLWQGGKDKDGVNYGSYKYVYLRELKEREYDVEWIDYMPGIRYTDVVFNTETKKYEKANVNQN